MTTLLVILAAIVAYGVVGLVVAYFIGRRLKRRRQVDTVPATDWDTELADLLSG